MNPRRLSDAGYCQSINLGHSQDSCADGFGCPQQKENRMPLEKLIELIAEVAVKRTTQQGKRETETTGAAFASYWNRWKFQVKILPACAF